MIIRSGVDVCSIRRVRDLIKKEGDRFLHRVYTEREIEYCESKKVTRYQHYAARFAAKEAFLKALEEDAKTLRMKDIEIVRSASGKPTVVLPDKKRKAAHLTPDTNIVVSMSHERDVAVSLVLLITLPKFSPRSAYKNLRIR